MVSADRISLVLPYKADYVSVARLTASGICSRIGFDIETIEDIKVSVSEVCSRIINAAAGLSGGFEILFEISEKDLMISFTSNIDKIRCIFKDDEDGLSMSIINAFMDQVEFCPDKENTILSMTKTFEVISGNGL